MRQRIARLELATRFRPIHIDSLILVPAPPARFEDFFYRPAESPEERGAESQSFFRALVSAAGIDVAPGRDEKTLLEEFQRAGCFLTEWSECPLDIADESGGEMMKNLAASVARRIKFSYRPKRVIPLSRQLGPHLSFFRDAGLGEKLVLKDDRPVEIPDFKNAAAVARFQRDLTALLAKAAPRSGAVDQP
ncbi:MAG: hypothetical protein WBE20_11090 [Candidatus Acidiferrales bacterium]